MANASEQVQIEEPGEGPPLARTWAPTKAGSRDSAAAGLASVVEFVLRHYAEPLGMQELSAAAGMPANSLTRIFNRHYGISPKRWVWYFRTILAAALIAKDPAAPLSLAWSQCGFMSGAHFSRRFREVYRQAPTTWRARLVSTGVQGRPDQADKPQFRRFTQEAERAAARALVSLGKG